MKIQFKLKYDSRWGENLFLIGNNAETGCWDTNRAIALRYTDFSIWETELNLNEISGFEYKYFIREGERIVWEDGENRTICKTNSTVCDCFRKGDTSDSALHSKVYTEILKEWEGSGVGVAVPVFSLRTNDDFGIGEFKDLKKLGDWCHKCGMQIIQILPINDTTSQWNWADSYPYNAISAFALNPIYLNLKDLGIDIKSETLHATSLQDVDFPTIQKTKWQYFQTVYQKSWNKTKKTDDYIAFFNENQQWLKPYAAFCYLRDFYHTTDFKNWNEHAIYDEQRIENLLNAKAPEIEIHYFLQYHLDHQLRNAVNYLHSLGIAIKGDIPIGVSPNSVEAWILPHLFNLNGQAGAPPDAFAQDGQNWGFPTYNWTAMAEDNYLWWRQRLQKMSQYFDAYRVDHILGFFRIWEIPQGEKSGLKGHFSPALPLTEHEIFSQIEAKGRRKNTILNKFFLPDPYENKKHHPRINLQKIADFKKLTEEEQQALNEIHEDYFYHRHNGFWKDKAMEKLPALTQATAMMACGEDLGMIPTTVPEVMQELGILSLEVQRMPKTLGDEFVSNDKVPYLSVYTTGTHDMPTLRAWLAEDEERTKRFLASQSIDDDEITAKTLQKILRKHAESNVLWKIYPLQDLLDLDERYWSDEPKNDQINVPADPNNHWKYRMKPTIEELIQSENNEIAETQKSCFGIR